MEYFSEFNTFFGVSHPWETNLSSISSDYSNVQFIVDYNSDKIICPICGVVASITMKEKYTLRLPEVFPGLKTKLTAFIPLLNAHNIECKADKNPILTSNTILLDIIVKQTNGLNPFIFFFGAVSHLN